MWAAAHAADVRSKLSERSEAVGYATGLMAWLLAGTVVVAVKGVTGEMPPWSITCGRSLISAAVLLPFVAGHRRDMAALLRRRWKEAALIGAIGLGLTQGVMFTALGYTSAVNVGMVFALVPIITMLLARLVLGEAMNGWQALGSAIAFCGIVVVSVQGSLANLLALQIGVGDLIALVGVACFAAYTVLLKRARFELPMMPLLVILLAFGSMASLPLAVLEYLGGAHDNLGTRGYLALLYCGVVGGALMYLAFNTSIDILGAARAGTLGYTQMIFVALFAWLFLGETIAWFHFAGAGLVVVGLLLITLLRPKPAARAT